MNKILMAAAVLAFTSAGMAASAAPTDKALDKKQTALMHKGMAMARIKMDNPATAKFREVFFNENASGVPVTCGEIDTKNAQGKYAGFQRFVSGGNPDTTFLQAQVPAFDQIWKQYCV